MHSTAKEEMKACAALMLGLALQFLRIIPDDGKWRVSLSRAAESLEESKIPSTSQDFHDDEDADGEPDSAHLQNDAVWRKQHRIRGRNYGSYISGFNAFPYGYSYYGHPYGTNYGRVWGFRRF
ncbi:hypothetical protein BESB_044430 [Besnoitia besnoiti]|uniref:Uncharacterized protein n=1 Tax=Besnoitia besnoiti TaxID=94643 RepID=A0A2A9MJ22_BESBE|nr:hypothetical protein BESB_044430 [Besnoitia besnoiti]PFH36251.1 hypothetical protein BESB_044430 [Besnoitia besnoiti]